MHSSNRWSRPLVPVSRTELEGLGLLEPLVRATVIAQDSG
jgi:hypothetical protein